MTINYEALGVLETAVLKAREVLGVTADNPHGHSFDDTEATDEQLHDTCLELLRAVEGLQNWAVDVTRSLADLGVEVHNYPTE